MPYIYLVNYEKNTFQLTFNLIFSIFFHSLMARTTHVISTPTYLCLQIWSPTPSPGPRLHSSCHPGHISLLLYTWFARHDNVDTTSTIQLVKSPKETLTKSKPQVGKSGRRIFNPGKDS